MKIWNTVYWEFCVCYYTSLLKVLEIAKIGLSENLTHLPSGIFDKITQHKKFPIYMYDKLVHIFSSSFQARRGGVEVADRTIRVRFPAYPHRLLALWWQGGKRHLWTSRCPCLGRLSTLQTASCPWHWVPGSRSKFGNWTTVLSLYSWNIAECDIKQQPTNHLFKMVPHCA